MRKIGRPYNSAVKVGRGQTVELARVWPAELHPPPTFHLLSLFARLPRAIYTSNNFTAQLHVTYQPLFPPFAAEGDSSPCSVNYSIPVKFFSRSIDEGRATTSECLARKLLSFFPSFLLSCSTRRDQEERDVRSQRSISSRKLSLNRNANWKIFLDPES